MSRYRLCDNDVIASDHSYAVVCDEIFLSEFSSSVVTYIAGRFAKTVCEVVMWCIQGGTVVTEQGSVV